MKIKLVRELYIKHNNYISNNKNNKNKINKNKMQKKVKLKMNGFKNIKNKQ